MKSLSIADLIALNKYASDTANDLYKLYPKTYYRRKDYIRYCKLSSKAYNELERRLKVL